MQIISARIPRAGPELSRAAQLRLKWITHYQTRSRKVALTCRYFGISRQTFYRWKRRFDPQDLTTLAARSCRPHQPRQLTWTPALVEAVLRLRRHYPRWGKDKLAVLLRREGRRVSTSMVSRILTQLKRRAQIAAASRSGRTTWPGGYDEPFLFQSPPPVDTRRSWG